MNTQTKTVKRTIVSLKLPVSVPFRRRYWRCWRRACVARAGNACANRRSAKSARQTGTGLWRSCRETLAAILPGR
jgi:hypothetical protein